MCSVCANRGAETGCTETEAQQGTVEGLADETQTEGFGPESGGEDFAVDFDEVVEGVDFGVLSGIRVSMASYHDVLGLPAGLDEVREDLGTR